MEPVGSTYSFPLTSDVPYGRNAGVLREVPTDSTEQKSDKTAFRRVSSANNPDQKGLQPSERATDEFKPYTRLGTQGSGQSGDTDKLQRDIAQAGDSREKQDPQVQAQILALKAIEEKVKAHEAAHKSAGGTITGPVSYSYTRGPDGKNYITGGEVPISVSPGKTPQETISRMQQVIRAALAPADPSPQDRAVAAQAATQQQEARQQLDAVPATGTAPTGFPEPQKQPDSVAARNSQHAYGNPAVTGKQPGTSASPETDQQDSQSAASSLSGATRSLQAIISPTKSTDTGASRPVSYYA